MAEARTPPTLSCFLEIVGDIVAHDSYRPMRPSLPALTWRSWSGRRPMFERDDDVDGEAKRDWGPQHFLFAPDTREWGRGSDDRIEALGHMLDAMGVAVETSGRLIEATFADFTVQFAMAARNGHVSMRPIRTRPSRITIVSPAHAPCGPVLIRDGEAGLARMRSLAEAIATLSNLRAENPKLDDLFQDRELSLRAMPARHEMGSTLSLWCAGVGLFSDATDVDRIPLPHHDDYAHRWEPALADAVAAWYAPASLAARHKAKGPIFEVCLERPSSATLAAFRDKGKPAALEAIEGFLDEAGIDLDVPGIEKKTKGGARAGA